MTILVTGGAGFIGSNFILDWLGETGEPVINVDKLTYAGNPANLKAVANRNDYSFVHAGIEDDGAISSVLQSGAVRAVVNFAAETHVDRSILGPEPFAETNVVGTLRLLEAVRAHWAELVPADRERFRFLHVSTDEVYGTLEPGDPAFTEETPYRPNSPYAASKAAADHFVRAYGETYGLPVITTNCSNNYGPCQFPEKLIPLVIHNALHDKPLPVYGDGLQVRDWLYVKDHCSALRRVLSAGMPGRAYNIGGNSERTNIDVVREICTVLDSMRPRADGRSYAEQIAFVKDRPGHDRRYAINTTRITRELGWTPAESFEAGIMKTIAWYLSNDAWVAGVTSGAYRDWLSKQYA
jgi:dTDP-glucose 4,6-dehydratase